MNEFSDQFRDRLPGQAEVCARKTLEILQKDLQGEKKLLPEEVYFLARAADLLLNICDVYGKK